MTRLVKNWLQGYLAYTAESESPEGYHLWVGISCIAGAIRRKAFFPMGYFLLYPNMYTVLVGPPGRCKKSTAMRVGRQMLGGVEGIHFTTDSVTRERLIMDLGQTFVDGHSSMTAFSSEFASLLTSSGMDMVVFLTDIFDSPDEWTHRTKIGGTNTIKAPYLNLIGATTPDWIAKAMPLDTIGIGLTSRIVFVYEDTPRIKDPFPVLSEGQKKLGQMLIQDLSKIALIAGQYRLTGDAEEYYTIWYRKRIENPNPTNDPRLNGYFERKPMHMLKLCMILAAAETDSTIIELEHVQEAMAQLERTEQSMPKVFANVGKNPFATDIEEIYTALVQVHPDGMIFGEILNRFKHNLQVEDLSGILNGMQQMGHVVLRESHYYANLAFLRTALQKEVSDS